MPTAPRAGPHPRTHYPGLDGLRGIAVLAVLLFHGGVPWVAVLPVRH